MKALTICQPYAWLITLPQSDNRHKRSENRTWYTTHRGPILIHAGMSKKWLKTWDAISPSETAALVYGAIVAKANLAACYSIDLISMGTLPREHEWLREHVHCEGPFCWILEQVEPCEPIACGGKLGLWDYEPNRLVPTTGGLFT